MARPSTTAALLLLALSLLAVAADHDTEPKSVTAMAVSDDNGLSSNPTSPAEDDASAIEEKVRPAEQQHGIEFLRLPSHQLHRHRPCGLHRHLWKRQHGAPRRFHDDHYSGHGERRDAVSHLAILPSAAEEAREAEEVKPVAEPDSDRSLPDSDGEGELVATTDPSSFVDTDAHDGERAAAVRAWKKEVLRRWFHFHFHHGLRRHRLHHVHHDEEEEEEEAAPEKESMNMKRFQFHHHHEEDDEKNNIVRKRLGHADHGHDMDSDDEDKQIEEMVRRFRQAIMRRRFSHGHGRRFFHHNHKHRHAEEAEKQAGGDEQSGVMAWIKALMNRF